MLPSRVISPVALMVAVFVFALTLAGSIGSVDHFHSGDIDHAVLHSNLECIWMCAASSFVGVGETHFPFFRTRKKIADPKSVLVIFENIFSDSEPRAPPVFL